MSKREEIIEQIKALTKEELLALMFSECFLFRLRDIDLRVIQRARGKVVRAKAEAAFAKYEEIVKKRREAFPNTDNLSLGERIIFLQSIQEGEVEYQKYVKLTDKADILEFGRTFMEKKNSHA